MCIDFSKILLILDDKREIISLKGFENSFLNSFKILVGILFGPLALFVFNELIRSCRSSGTAGKRKIVFLVSGPRYER